MRANQTASRTARCRQQGAEEAAEPSVRGGWARLILIEGYTFSTAAKACGVAHLGVRERLHTYCRRVNPELYKSGLPKHEFDRDGEKRVWYERSPAIPGMAARAREWVFQMSQEMVQKLKPPTCKACKQSEMTFQWIAEGNQYFWVCPKCRYSTMPTAEEKKQFAPKAEVTVSQVFWLLGKGGHAQS